MDEWRDYGILEERKNSARVLELCYFECYQNIFSFQTPSTNVLELCYFECYQNRQKRRGTLDEVLELYYSEYQHTKIKCIAITKPWLNLKRS